MAQAFVSGMLLGGVYAEVALAISLIWGVVKVVHMGQVPICFVAAYVTYWLFFIYNIDPFISLVLTIPLFFAMSWLLGSSLIRAIIMKADLIGLGNVSMMSLFGVGIFLEGLMLVYWTADPRAIIYGIPFVVPKIAIGTITVDITRLLMCTIGLICVLLVHLFLQRTWTGKAIRAVAQNKEAAAIMGVNTNYIYMFAFGIAGVLAAVSGQMILVLFSIRPSGYWQWMLKGFMITALGGVGSIRGSLIAALILGVIESITGIFIPFVYSQVIAVIILILILYLRPGVGLLGKKEMGV